MGLLLKVSVRQGPDREILVSQVKLNLLCPRHQIFGSMSGLRVVNSLFLGRLGMSCTSQTTKASTRGLRKLTNHREERIVTNEDGSVIIAWHPEPKFPYKYTKPVPRQHDMEAAVPPSQLEMKVQAVEDMKELYHHKNKRLQVRDLMRLTWTTKKRWFPDVTHNRKAAARDSPRERPFM